MAVNDIYQVTIDADLHGQVVLNTFHYRESATGAGSAAQSLLTAFKVAVFNKLKLVTADEITYDRLIAQKIRPLPPLAPVEDSTIFSAGSQAGGSLPSSMAVVISKKTSLAGRAYRGRCYFAGIPIGHESDSMLAAIAAPVWADVATGMKQVLIEGTWNFTPVVYHRGDGTWTDITQCVVRDILRNQRRRQVQKGV